MFGISKKLFSSTLKFLAMTLVFNHYFNSALIGSAEMLQVGRYQKLVNQHSQFYC